MAKEVGRSDRGTTLEELIPRRLVTGARGGRLPPGAAVAYWPVVTWRLACLAPGCRAPSVGNSMMNEPNSKVAGSWGDFRDQPPLGFCVACCVDPVVGLHRVVHQDERHMRDSMYPLGSLARHRQMWRAS